MRLPWLSRRSAGRATRGAAAAPAAGGDATQSDALPVGRSEWRDVGNLHPSFRADPGVRVQRFREGLAGSHLPDPILRPLGHQRSAHGPAGLVSGLTRPVISRVVSGPGSAQSLPLVHRRGAADVVDGADSPDIESPADLGSPTELPTVPLRQVPVVTADRVVARSMTSAGPADRRLVPGQRAPSLQRAEAPAGRAQMPGPSVPVVAGQSPGTIVGPGPVVARTIMRGAGRSKVRLGPPISAEVTPPATDPEPAGGPATGSATVSVPQAHVASRAIADAPLAGGLRPSIAANTPATHPATGAADADASGDTWTAPSGLVLARMVATAESPTKRAGDGPAPAPAETALTSRISAGVPDAPLVGSDPLTRTTWPQGDQMPAGRALDLTGPAALAHKGRGPTPSVAGIGSAAVATAGGSATASTGVAIQRSAVGVSATTSGGPLATNPTSSGSRATAPYDVDARGAAVRSPSADPVGRGAAVALVATPAGRAVQRSSTTTPSIGIATLGVAPTGSATSGVAPNIPAPLALARQTPRPSDAFRTSDATSASDETPGARVHTDGALAIIQRDGDSPAAAPAAPNQAAPPIGSSGATPSPSSQAGGTPSMEEVMARMQQIEADNRQQARMARAVENLMQIQKERTGRLVESLR